METIVRLNTLPSLYADFADAAEVTTKRAQGIDISHYQTVYTPQAHHDFVIAKAVEITTLNSKYIQHHDVVRWAGKMFGAYGYIRSGYGWEKQADALLEIAVAKNEADFLAVDFEKRGNAPSAQFAIDCGRYANYVAVNSGKRCLLYSSPSVIQEWMFQLKVYWPRTYPDLWLAQWPYKGWNERLREVPYPEKGWEPRLPAGCPTAKVWQYAADWNEQGKNEGVDSRDVDMDVFLGTVQEMQAWCNWKQEPVDPPVDASEVWQDGYETGLSKGIGNVIYDLEKLTEKWKN